MTIAEIITNYSSQYQNPITLVKGQIVTLGKTPDEEKWKGWIWAENSTQGGWVPLQILNIADNLLTAEVLEDYSAKELDVEEGEEVYVVQHLNGWVLAQHKSSGEEGWIPDENLIFK